MYNSQYFIENFPAKGADMNDFWYETHLVNERKIDAKRN